MRRLLAGTALAVGLAGALPATLLTWDAVRGSQSPTEASQGTSTAPAVAHLPACSGDVVSVWRDDPTPCDVTGQRLDVYGLSLAECDHWGGEYILTNPDDQTIPATYICEGADH